MRLNRATKILTTAAALALFVCARALCMVDLAETLPWDPDLVRGKLDNGFSYFILENRKPEKRAEILLIVKAGSLNEQDNEQGIAHFLEHMAFNGSKHFKPGELIKELEALGIEWGRDLNAGTGFDGTTYTLTVPLEGDNLDRAFTVMLDYAGGQSFLPEEIEKERGVILEEERVGRGLEQRLLEKALQIVLKGSKYPDRLPIGKVEWIKKFKAEDFKRFYKQWYRADRMAIAVVGDFDKAEMEKKIREAFSALEPPEDSRPAPTYPPTPHTEPYAGIVTDPELPVGMVTLLTFKEPRPLLNAGDFFRKTLENMSLSIYGKRLEEIAANTKNPPFKNAGAYNARWFAAFDMLAVYGIADMKKEMQTLETLYREAERIGRHGFLSIEATDEIAETREAYRRAVEEKDKTESSKLIRDIEDSFRYDFVFMDVEYERDLFERLAPQTSVEMFQKAFSFMFTRENSAALFELPEFMKKSYTEAKIKAAVETVRAEEIEPYARVEKKKEFDYTKLTPGKIALREIDVKTGATRVVFDNGLRALFKPTDFKQEEILFTSFAPGGALLEGYADRGLSSVAAMSWIEGGTKDFTRTEIDRMTTGKTIRLYANGGYNLALGGNTVTRDFEETLQWVYDYITAPAFREEAVDRARKTLIDWLRELPLNQDQFLDVTHNQVVCPDSPISALPTEKDIESATPERLAALLGKSLAASNMEFTFVGSFDLEKALELAARYLGGLPAASATPIPDDARTCDFPEGGTRRVIYRGMENRNVTLVDWPGADFTSPDIPVLSIMSKIVDIRMNDVIREEMGGTYSSYFYHSMDYYMKGGNYFTAYFTTDPAKVDQMTARLYEILDGLKKAPPTEEEMNRAREVFIKDFEDNVKKNDYWLNILRGADTAGRPADFYLAVHEAKLKVTPEQVSEAAAKYFTEKNRVEIIAMPGEKAE